MLEPEELHMRRMLAVIALVAASAAAGVPYQYPEGELWAFPSLTDLQGKLLGKGRFGQWVDRQGIHVRATYDQLNGDRIVETTLLSTDGSQLSPREWSWQRTRRGQVVERYSVDLSSGEARTLVVRGNKREQRRAHLEVTPGRTFAGIGFVFAVRNLHPRLVEGEAVELDGIAFTPQPRKGKVRITNVGVETLRVGGRSLRADHILIHADLPSIARLFVKVPDSHLWFYRARPPGFLRAQMPMQSLGVVRIESVSNGGAGPAARSQPPRR